MLNMFSQVFFYLLSVTVCQSRSRMSSISMSGRSQSLGQQDQDSEALSWDTAHHQHHVLQAGARHFVHLLHQLFH